MCIGKRKKREARRCRAWIACFAVCAVLAGCHGTDQALSLPAREYLAGEEATEQRSEQDFGGYEDDGRGDGVEVETPGGLYVHVCGAVSEPGVYELPFGSRACDALEAAGGLTKDASESFVNLAEPLQDGMQLYFPTAEEGLQLREQAQKEESGLVNINAADVALLCTLPGIGASKAEDIVSYREAHGGFQSPEEIMQVPGIKEGAYAKIRDKITVQ